MNFKRFKNIITENTEYEIDIKETIKEFEEKVFVDGDIPKVIKEVGIKLNILIIEIPMKDSDFGACYLENNYSKYLLLNSNQPRCKMYFSFCHDIYHIVKGTPNYINEKREVHFNEKYFENENENKANLFAANLMMPETEFRKMYKIFKEDVEEVEHVIVKLMNYFNSPFVAVLIRIYELRILTDAKIAKRLLDYDSERIKGLFEELWLDKDILEPSYKDEMKYLLDKMKKEGKDLIEENLLSAVNYENIIKNIQNLYNDIRMRHNE